MLLFLSMSTLSSEVKESVDQLGTNTLLGIMVGFSLLCFLDLVRGIEFSRDTAMVNALGAFFTATPLMLTTAARNVGRWSTSEYTGLTLVSLVLVVTIGLPVIAMNMGDIRTSIKASNIDARLLTRFEGFSAISAGLSLTAFAAFVLCGTRAKVWSSHQRNSLSS